MIHIDFFYLFLGLFVGLFIVYTTTAPPKIILKYPTVDNIDNTTYVDDVGKCYKYYAEQINC